MCSVIAAKEVLNSETNNEPTKRQEEQEEEEQARQSDGSWLKAHNSFTLEARPDLARVSGLADG